MALVSQRSNGLTSWNSNVMPTASSPWSLIDRLFDDFGTAPLAARVPVDIIETDSHVLIALALPGVKPDDLDVQVERRTLTIRGRYAPVAVEGKRSWVKGLPSGDFEYHLTLPVNVETETVNATLDAGLLHLELPKVPEARTKKIEIKQLSRPSMKAIG